MNSYNQVNYAAKNNTCFATRKFSEDKPSNKARKDRNTDINISEQCGKLATYNSSKFRETISIINLPQHFECKYLGKIQCNGLWGLKFIRQGVEKFVKRTRRLKSFDELSDFEALISDKGIFLVQKKRMDENLPTNTYHKIIYKSGLLPLSKISYAAQDPIYTKIFSCIMIREVNEETISECFSFLCGKSEIAKKMALSLSLAFKEYGKIIDKNNNMNKLKLTNESPEDENVSFV